MDDILMQNAYLRYRNAKAIQESNMSMFLHACGAKAGLRDFNYLTEAESIGDSIKNAWEKFIAFIKKVFMKLTNNLARLFGMEKSWLDKYKDTILKTKPHEDLKITDAMDYKKALDRITTKAIVPVLDYKNMAADLADRATFISKHFPDMASNQGECFPDGYDTNLTDGMVKYFTGGNTVGEISFQDLNFTDMFNFCYNKEQILKYITTDNNNINKSSQSVQSAIASAIDDASKENQTTPTTAEANKLKDELNKLLEKPNVTEEEVNKKLEEFKKAAGTKASNLTISKDGQNGYAGYSVELSGGETNGVYVLKKKDTATNNNGNSNNTGGNTSNTNNQNDKPKTKEEAEEKLNNLIDKKVNGNKEKLDNYATVAGVQINDLDKLDKNDGKDYHLRYRNNSYWIDEATFYGIDAIIYSDILNEGEIVGTSSSSSSSSSGGGNSSVSSAMKGQTSGEVNKDYNGADIKGDKTAQAAKEEVEKKVAVYTGVCSSVFSAKSTAVNKLFKEFMNIMKAHVEKAIDQGDNAQTINAKSATNYSNNRDAENVYTTARMQQLDGAKEDGDRLVDTVKSIYKQNFSIGQDQTDNIKRAKEKYNQFLARYKNLHPEDTTDRKPIEI